MIVEPDFPDHWKTRLFTALCLEYEREHAGTLDGEGPVMLILRLWAHCHQRKAFVFPGMKAGTLAAIVRWKGDPDQLKEMLLEARWLDKYADGVSVHGWGEVNAGLISNWKNGKKGGRPKGGGKPTDNPNVTQRKPTDNPEATHSKPIDQIEREDRGSERLPTPALGSPSVGELTEHGKKMPPPLPPAPESYARHHHREKTKRRSFGKTDWRMDFEDWWRNDHATWGMTKKRGGAEKENGGENAALVKRLADTNDPKERLELLKQVAS